MTISNCETTSSNHAVKLQMKNISNIYYSSATARTLFLHPVVSYPQGVLTTLDDTSAATRIKYCIINKCHEAKNRRKIIGLQSVFATRFCYCCCFCCWYLVACERRWIYLWMFYLYFIVLWYCGMFRLVELFEMSSIMT